MLRPLWNTFWSEALWLPPNVRWSDVAPGPGKAVVYTDHRHLFLAVPFSLLLLALRIVLNKYIYAPIGKAVGIKHDRNVKVFSNHKLEAAYRANPASIQGITNGVWWLYMVALGFYLSQTLSLYTDVRRKDFWQQVVHHAATLAIMCLSWVCNFHRIGSLVMLSLDCSETLLEATKATKYAGYHRASDYMFAAFTALWIATRIGIFPYYIVRSVTYQVFAYLPPFPVLQVQIFLLWVLLALNVYWTWLILRLAYRALKHGQVEGDIRSSSSEFSDSSTTAHAPNRDRQIGI